jgi:hypothetical protein
MPNMHRRLLQDGSRENWWCSLPEGRYWPQDPAPAAPAAPAFPAFLNEDEKRQWREENEILVATPNATEYLAALVLPWAKEHPRDPDLPPALRMIVRSARGGCVSDSTRMMGRTAFRHLHRYFPTRQETVQTRTW